MNTKIIFVVVLAIIVADTVDIKNKFSAGAAILFGGRCGYFQRPLKIFLAAAEKPQNIVNSS